MPTNVYESCVDALDIIDSGLATQDQLLQAKELVTALGEAYRAIKERVDAGMVKHIQAHGAIEVGNGRRFYVANEKVKKCLSVKDTLEYMLATTSMEDIVGTLSTSAFKPAAAMKLLGEKASLYFSTEDRPKLNEKGEVVPQLQEANERFTG